MDSDDFDGAWKETLEHYLQPFLELCFPAVASNIDWLMALPNGLAVAFRQDLIQYEQQKAMPYVTSIERIGRQEGRQEGLQEGLQEGQQKALRDSISEVLEERCQSVPWELRERINTVQEPDRLKQLLRCAATAPSLAEFSARF